MALPSKPCNASAIFANDAIFVNGHSVPTNAGSLIAEGLASGASRGGIGSAIGSELFLWCACGVWVFLYVGVFGVFGVFGVGEGGCVCV